MSITGDELLKRYIGLLDDALDFAECGYRRSRPEMVIRRREMSEETGPREAENAAAADSLEAIAGEVAACKKCRLCEGRNHTVPGEGVTNPLVMCIGEAPGADEDRTGRPFVGKAGQYLDKWLEAVELYRDKNCFIGNIIKCRPPGNRDPQQDETEACIPYLTRQLNLIKPKMILTLGRISSQILAETSRGIGALRGSTFTYMGIPCIPTYHPSAVLRNPDLRKPVWDDLRRLKGLIDNG